jgi:hypothetical protein
VKRVGFQQDCKAIAELTPEELLQAIAKLGEGADFRSIIHDEKVPENVRKAVKSLVLCTGDVIGTEGHRTQIRHKIHAYGMHFGQSQIFITPNLADNRLALLVELHTGPPDVRARRGRNAEDVEARVEKYRLDLLDEMPKMPTGEEMMRILASDSVAQAKVFHLMITLFFEIILGTTPPLQREFLPARWTNDFEDGFAASALAGCFGDVACAIGPVETQGRGSQHPHTLVTLIGHAIVTRLRQMMESSDEEVLAALQAWREAVLRAAEQIQYDSQQVLAKQLDETPVPTPLNEEQRNRAGAQYEDLPLREWERDGNELKPDEVRRAGGKIYKLKLTGAYTSILPLYRRRAPLRNWKAALYTDYRRLVIHNHFHKCGASCFKKGRRSKSGVTICRFGCVHFEKVAVEDEKGKTVFKSQVKRGWRHIKKASFADPAQKKDNTYFDEHEAGKFMPERDEPYGGMSHPTPQVCLRCNVDVKYLGRCPTDSDMKTLQEQISGEAVEAPSATDNKGQQKKKRFSFLPDSWTRSRAKMALWSVVLDAERYMKDVQHYVGEYAAKKFEVARSLLPELYRGPGCCASRMIG